MPEHDRYLLLSTSALSPAARLRDLKPDWLNDPKVWRTEILAGLVVALALIPEAISFSIIAGVDPAIGLFASFTMAVTISIVGGRRAMISAATGAVALVIAPLNREHGFGYLVARRLLDPSEWDRVTARITRGWEEIGFLSYRDNVYVLSPTSLELEEQRARQRMKFTELGTSWAAESRR